jgi:hypothetical protein
MSVMPALSSMKPASRIASDAFNLATPLPLPPALAPPSEAEGVVPEALAVPLAVTTSVLVTS